MEMLAYFLTLVNGNDPIKENAQRNIKAKGRWGQKQISMNWQMIIKGKNWSDGSACDQQSNLGRPLFLLFWNKTPNEPEYNPNEPGI